MAAPDFTFPVDDEHAIADTSLSLRLVVDVLIALDSARDVFWRFLFAGRHSIEAPVARTGRGRRAWR